MDGTYKTPGSSAANVEMSAVQQSIFNAPAPGSAPAPARGLPAKPPASGTKNEPPAEARGQKRTRDEEDEDEDSDEDVAMEEDSDDE